MTPLLDWALANAVLVVPLAVLAAAGSLLRRPVLTHALWLLALLRLFAPPLWHVSLPDWRKPAAVEPPTVASRQLDSPRPPVNVPAFELPAAPETQTTEEKPVTAAEPIRASTVLGTIWLGGAIGCLGLTTIRGLAFRRLLRFAEPAPAAWQRLGIRLARRIGLRRTPRIELVRGPVSPLLWAAFGRPRVLLPADLAARLDCRSRAALLVHELAHLRRGDHWVRWLEVLATAAYWWHPVVWLARRGLREAEEQCCDAWVVWALPAARRAYADALVDTADFLGRAVPALPPLASGLGAVGPLRRRVVMIMRGGVPHRLSRSGLLVAFTIGVVLLALKPVQGQDPGDRPTPRPKGVDREEEVQPPPRRSDETAELRQQIRQLRRQLADAERKLAAFEGGQLPGEALPRDPTASGRGRRAPTSALPPRPASPDQPGPDQPGSIPPPPVPPTPPRPAAAPTAPPGLPPGAANERSSDGRISDLERELAALRREIALMRREMRRGSGDRPREP